MTPRSNRFHHLQGLPIFASIDDMAPFVPKSCTDCQRMVTNIEQRCYGGRCAGCDWRWYHRFTAWQGGAQDAELDLLVLGLASDAVRH